MTNDVADRVGRKSLIMSVELVCLEGRNDIERGKYRLTMGFGKSGKFTGEVPSEIGPQFTPTCLELCFEQWLGRGQRPREASGGSNGFEQLNAKRNKSIEPVSEWCRRVNLAGQDRVHALLLSLNGSSCHLVFVGEITKDRSMGNAGSLCYLGHARPGHALPDKFEVRIDHGHLVAISTCVTPIENISGEASIG